MKSKMRVYHRYLGFFLAGIMTVYALSGVTLIFRNTEVFKVEKRIEKTLEPGLEAKALGKALRIRRLKVREETEEQIVFARGTYHKKTGEVGYKIVEPPLLLKKFESMHKASTSRPLFFFNIFFGLALFFFVVSSFFMFAPRPKPFKTGMYFTGAGLVLTVVMVLV